MRTQRAPPMLLRMMHTSKNNCTMVCACMLFSFFSISQRMLACSPSSSNTLLINIIPCSFQNCNHLFYIFSLRFCVFSSFFAKLYNFSVKIAIAKKLSESIFIFIRPRKNRHNAVLCLFHYRYFLFSACLTVARRRTVRPPSHSA